MGKTFEGNLLGKGFRFGVVVSRFNEFFSGKLLEGAKDALNRHGVLETDVEVAWTPGSFVWKWPGRPVLLRYRLSPKRWPRAANITPSFAWGRL